MGGVVERSSLRSSIASSDFHTHNPPNNEACCSCCARICAFIYKIFSDLNRTSVRLYESSPIHASSKSQSTRLSTIENKTATVPEEKNRRGSLYSVTGSARMGALSILSSESMESLRPVPPTPTGMQRLEGDSNPKSAIINSPSTEQLSDSTLYDVPLTPSVRTPTGMQRLEEREDNS